MLIALALVLTHARWQAPLAPSDLESVAKDQELSILVREDKDEKGSPVRHRVRGEDGTGALRDLASVSLSELDGRRQRARTATEAALARAVRQQARCDEATERAMESAFALETLAAQIEDGSLGGDDAQGQRAERENELREAMRAAKKACAIAEHIWPQENGGGGVGSGGAGGIGKGPRDSQLADELTHLSAQTMEPMRQGLRRILSDTGVRRVNQWTQARRLTDKPTMGGGVFGAEKIPEEDDELGDQKGEPIQRGHSFLAGSFHSLRRLKSLLPRRRAPVQGTGTLIRANTLPPPKMLALLFAMTSIGMVGNIGAPTPLPHRGRIPPTHDCVHPLQLPPSTRWGVSRTRAGSSS